MFSAPPTKRQFSDPLPTPEELARALKRTKPGPLSGAAPSSRLPGWPQQIQSVSRYNQPIPTNAMPIVDPPFRVSDFFIDKPELDPPVEAQLKESVSTHPPPAEPVLFSDGVDKNELGIMIPFVYPPIPSIVLDPWTNVPDELEGRPRYKDTTLYPVIAPLPFPPPGFMPYPIVSNDGLAPNEVVDLWLDASARLPRIDMVVASAAGSIYDMRAQAEAAGLDTAKLDEIVRLSQLADSDPEASDDRSSDASADESESRIERYMEYINGIDTSEAQDPHRVEVPENIVEVEPDIKAEYLRISPDTSKEGEDVPSRAHNNSDLSMDSTYFGQNLPELPVDEEGKDVANASGFHKEKRREALLQKVNELEEYAQTNREQLYLTKKQQLLERLRLLQSSRLHFDSSKDSVHDDTLDHFKNTKEVRRDEELFWLKNAHTFERLKAVSNFIQTSNRSYKTMNSVMINKLQKLRNFIAYQHQIFKEAINSKASGDSDPLSIRNRDSAKIFNGYVDQDYSSEIKEEFRVALAKEDGASEESAEKFDPSLFRKVYTNWQHDASVNDYMPLVTREEFLMITGEAPNKTGPTKETGNKAKSARHQIFQSPLYDRVTSGSDTNSFDPAVPVKRRPGRRAAPKPTYGEEVSKQSNEAALVAKIMKQFVGPAGANNDEIGSDFQSIGIESKWQIK